MLKLCRWLVFVVAMVVLAACAGPTLVARDQVHFYRNPSFVPPSLGVVTDFKLYDANNPKDKAAIAARYTNVYIENQSYDDKKDYPILKEAYAKVGPNQLGIIDNYILAPGNYFDIAASDVTIVPAAVVAETEIGILKSIGEREVGQVTYTLLPPGVHRALTQQVRVFPSGPLRYRLLDANLLENPAACQSTLCESTLSDVLTSDPGVRMKVDLEVNFQISTEEDDLAKLFELGNINALITTYLSSPIRSRGRTLWGTLSPGDTQTTQGRIQMQEMLSSFVENELKEAPVDLISVGIRGASLPDDYLAEQSAGAAEQQALQAELSNAKLSQDATAIASEFSRQQQTLETEHLAQQIVIIKNALGSDDPIVMCGVLNFFKPGACSAYQPVSVTTGVQSEPGS